jgi:DNA ligase-1
MADKKEKILLQPARCVASLDKEFKEHHVGEEKLDGSRYVLYLNCDPYGRRDGNALLSRRVSVKDDMHVDRTDQVPHITDVNYKGLDGTVLDGEVFLTDFKTTSSIISSGPALAVQKQEAGEWLTYRVFDVPVFRGIDIRGKPLSVRRKVLETVVERMNNEYVEAIEQFPADQIKDKFTEITNEGGEGCIVKDVRQGYGMGWAKMKKSYEVSCFISGFKPGKGKYKGMVGAIEISVMDGDKPVAVGFASGFVDSVREDMSEEPENFIGKVVDVYAHEISSGGRLRHPTFYRFRDSIPMSDCTMEKLRADLKKKVKSSRWRGK